MNNKLLNMAIFVLSFICLIISVKLFWNMGIYVDEYNAAPSIVYGGDFWLYMDWLRLGFSAFICILSGINLFKKVK